MEIKALVLYKDHYALYLISRENEGIFTAVLRRYDGDRNVFPPGCITLTKSVRCWKGSIDDQILIDELGEVIEINIQSGVFQMLKDKDTDLVE